MGYVCRARGWPLVVYCATTANPMKVERMRAMGAEVRLHSEDFDAAKEEARRLCAESGAYFVENGAEASIAEGAGTIARELLQRRRFDTVLVPLGNGALLTGMERWIGACARSASGRRLRRGRGRDGGVVA
ncbi:MAG: pyridoxal-phosphate dependent enzyme [Variovorax sp.]|nr:MAG: pyridoxal-phosphate dependent enzyme [Variovorax sp.]